MIETLGSKGGLAVKAVVGDRIEIRGRHVGEVPRLGEIIEVKGPEGDPPFVVKWSDGHEGIVFPGPDAVVVHAGQP